MQVILGDSWKDFKGICVTDGYQVYHTIENEREDLKIAGCWAHSRRRFDEAVKALPKSSRSNSLAYLALKQIQAIYREENKLADMTFEERLEHRQLTVKPLVDAYFTWVKKILRKFQQKERHIMVSVILLIRKNIFVYFWKMVLFRWIITLRSNLSVVSVSGKRIG